MWQDNVLQAVDNEMYHTNITSILDVVGDEVMHSGSTPMSTITAGYGLDESDTATVAFNRWVRMTKQALIQYHKICEKAPLMKAITKRKGAFMDKKTVEALYEYELKQLQEEIAGVQRIDSTQAEHIKEHLQAVKREH